MHKNITRKYGKAQVQEKCAAVFYPARQQNLPAQMQVSTRQG
jgi:hypothetical protein